MSVLVERTMAELNEERKAVFPLFQRGPKPQPMSTSATTTDLNKPQAGNQSEMPSKRGRPRKKSKDPSIVNSQSATIQPPQADSQLLEVDPNDARRKRRKTASPDHQVSDGNKDDIVENRKLKDAYQGQPQKPLGAWVISSLSKNVSQVARMEENSAEKVLETGISPAAETNTRSSISSYAVIDLEHMRVKETAPSALDTCQPHEVSSKEDMSFALNPGDSRAIATAPMDIKPKKVLRLNPKTGTIGSPPPKKSITSLDAVSKVSVSRRERKPKTKLVVVQYAEGENYSADIGQKIAKILNGPGWSETRPVIIPPMIAKATPLVKPKPLHSMFLGKPTGKTSQLSKKATGSTETIGLTDPTTQTTTKNVMGQQPQVRPHSENKSQISAPKGLAGSFAGFGNSSKLVKFPGAVEPAWPWQGMVHIRGTCSTTDTLCRAESTSLRLLSRAKKSKYQAVDIYPNEDILQALAHDLCVKKLLGSLKENDPNEYPPPPACLRAPWKHNESGYKLQERVRKEVRANLSRLNMDNEGLSEKEVQIREYTRDNPHPALVATFDLISTSLSAFDNSRCETQVWTRKYSPKSAAEVLQEGREAIILKEWLEKLTVNSVMTSIEDKSKKNENAGKRKRKSKRTDDFIVASDDEDTDIDELSEPDEDSEGRLEQQMKTFMRASKDGKVSNAVVLSGPHGCGKTAAVYAVAEELGFEVFEINSGSRRSGKDIMERVGDMTRNHLVQQSKAPLHLDETSEDKRWIDESFANDLNSGRQGTVNSFFKSKGPATPKPVLRSNMMIDVDAMPSVKPQSSTKTQKVLDGIMPKASSKKQKQSLILIEEVDVLFKEDTQFWVTVNNLIAMSKRPIIMTCNDESAVPLASLPTQGIIRMTSAPIELAVDYMLSVSGCEGHAISRDAVRSLYESRHLDLRASLTELNFWCQFGIGDIPGGLGWFLPRWPLGSDIDEHGNRIRVVSEGTYQTGMGYLSQDFIESHIHHLDLEEEILHEAWDHWRLDVGDWSKTIDMGAWAQTMQAQSKSKADNQAALRMYDHFADAMSAGDLFSHGAFAPENQAAIDITAPRLTDKARDNFPIAFELHDISLAHNFQNLGKDLSIWMKSRSRNYLHVHQHISNGFEVPTELDSLCERKIIDLIRSQVTWPEEYTTRPVFSAAFDPISYPEKYPWLITNSIEASVFDRTMNIIVEDMAPYVRSIVAYDIQLQQNRAKVSNLLSEGGSAGKRSKRVRTTRSAISALEGSVRSNTRRDRYFGSALNLHLVMKTGLPSWTEAAAGEAAQVAGSRRSSRGSLDISTIDSEKDEPAECARCVLP